MGWHGVLELGWHLYDEEFVVDSGFGMDDDAIQFGRDGGDFGDLG